MARKDKRRFQNSPSSGGGKYKQLVSSVFLKNPGASLTHKQICYLLDCKTPAERKGLFDALVALVSEKKIQQINHHTFSMAVAASHEGVLEMTAKGFGFIRVSGTGNDVLIREENKGNAIDGDKVIYSISRDRNGKKEGVVLSVIERGRALIAGTLQVRNQKAILLPDSSKYGVPIEIPENQLNGAQQGMRVVAKITHWPEQRKTPFGSVVALLGYPGSNDAEMLSILVNHGFDPFFPEEVMNEASLIPADISVEEVKTRLDIRDILTFTIDPVDAKDFDDALSFQRLQNGNLEIGVHIADVGHYIPVGSALDKEALRRSNSVYLVDRVLPMLPEQLSNVLCSLRPNEDKLAFSVFFEFDSSFDIIRHRFSKTVIHSNRRYTYEEAQQIIEGKDDPFKDEILMVQQVARSLRANRFKKGSLKIISEEVRFVLDEKGNPQSTQLKTSQDSHQLIEEFMLLANKTVATFLSPNKEKGDAYKTVYRIHDLPDLEKLGLLSLFCDKFGLELKIDALQKAAFSINTLLNQVEGEPYFPLIQSMVVKSMAKAAYSTENIGHFGLAFSHYTHFTSPIRRYADLIVHRHLMEKMTSSTIRMDAALDDVCKRISMNERKATEAERESSKFFQTLLLIDHLGETFDGIVSGISDYGIFVKILENHCEGMVSLPSLQMDRYYFDADSYVVVGKKTGKKINLGDLVKVIVDDVNPRKRQIDFILVEK